MRTWFLVVLAAALALVVSCEDDDCPACPDADFAMVCPPDTVIPINRSTDPDDTGLFPTIIGDCMDDPAVSYRDSTPAVGGFIRIWTAADTCGNADTCYQSIGQGAPAFALICPPDTVIPINCPNDPASIGLTAQVVGPCAADPIITYVDSSITGGIVRTWFAADSCGEADVCVQSIGLGAPDICQ